MGRKPKNQINQTENKDQPIIEEENLVKKTCRELGITQKELAERIGVTERSLSRYITSMPKNIENHINLIVDNFLKTEILNSLESTLTIAYNKIYRTI